MKVSEQLKSSGSIFECLNVVANWPVIRTFLLMLLPPALLLGFFAAFNHTFTTVLGITLAGMACVYSVSVAGIMLMDESRTETPAPPMQALVRALFTSHRLIAAITVAWVLLALLLLAVALLLLVCKIPFLGPLLYVIVLPVSVVAVALFLAVFALVFLPVVAPAIWSGATLSQAISTLWAVVRRKLRACMVHIFLLAVIAMIGGSLIFSILSFAMAAVTWLSSAILLADLHSYAAKFSSGFSGGYAAAYIAGLLLICAIASVLPLLIMMNGICKMYIHTIEGLDVDASAQELRQTLDQLKEKAEKTAHKVDAAVSAAKEKAVQTGKRWEAVPGDEAQATTSPPQPEAAEEPPSQQGDDGEAPPSAAGDDKNSN